MSLLLVLLGLRNILRRHLVNPLTNLFRKVPLDGTRMRLLVVHPNLGENVKNHARFYL
jgi:hypothetical protein